MKEQLRNSKTLNKIRSIIFSFIDFFYPPFKKILPLKTFRYAACGGSTALLNLFVFWFSITFIVDKNEKLDFGLFQMTPYIASFIIALLVSFPVGFLLNKYIVFQTSSLRGRVQLIRYGTMTALNIFLNYALLHLFIGIWHFWPTPSMAVTTILLAILSYFAQNHFSFGKHEHHQPEEMY